MRQRIQRRFRASEKGSKDEKRSASSQKARLCGSTAGGGDCGFLSNLVGRHVESQSHFRIFRQKLASLVFNMRAGVLLLCGFVLDGISVGYRIWCLGVIGGRLLAGEPSEISGVS